MTMLKVTEREKNQIKDERMDYKKEVNVGECRYDG